MSGQDAKRTLSLFFPRNGKINDVQVGEEERIMDILKGMDIPIDGVLVFSDNVPLPMDDAVGQRDRLTIINVASGG